MTVIFKCGHEVTLPRAVEAAPVCQQCGERIVARVLGATPTFTGACRSPLKVEQ